MGIDDVTHAYGYDGDNIGLVSVNDVGRRDKKFDVRRVPFSQAQLEMIPVIKKKTADRASNDDTIVYLVKAKSAEEWFARMATIGDGSCMIHAFLKCVYHKYQENSSHEYRTKMAIKVREQMAVMIENSNVSNVRSLYRRIEVDHIPEYTKSRIVNMLDSTEYLGEVAANILSMIFKVNIFMFDLKSIKESEIERPKLRSYTNIDRQYNVSIGILYVSENHFEPLVLKTEDGIQTKFIGTSTPIHRLYTALK